MEAGSLLDRNYVVTVNAVWSRAAPTPGAVDARDLELRTVTAYRCRSCGRLELYAHDLAQRGVSAAWKNPPPFE